MIIDSIRFDTNANREPEPAPDVIRYLVVCFRPLWRYLNSAKSWYSDTKTARCFTNLWGNDMIIYESFDNNLAISPLWTNFKWIAVVPPWGNFYALLWKLISLLAMGLEPTAITSPIWANRWKFKCCKCFVHQTEERIYFSKRFKPFAYQIFRSAYYAHPNGSRF